MIRTVQLMARYSLSIPSVALILWVLLTHFCSGVRVELGATVGESVTFACTVNVSGSVSWQWSKDGVVLTQSNSQVVGVGTENLTILSVEGSDFGNYSCSPNPADNQLRQDFILSVSPATVVSVLPSPVVLVNQTGSINLECVAGGGPENTFQWYYDNQLLPGETHSVLELTDIGLSGGGYFNCTVTNAAGTGSDTALVVVSGTLVFVNEPEDLTVTVEDSTSLNCDVAGSTPVTYQWYRNAEVLTDSNDHITGSTTATLSFDSVDPTDSGSYSCNASSGNLTVTSRQAILTVLTIRLVANGEGKLPQGQIEGRVEVYHNGVWGTVCDDYWDMNDARVVCRQLGYDFVLEAPLEAEYGAGTDQIWLDDVGCSGDESDIADCSHNGWGVVGLCDHSEDAGVKCSDTAPNVTLRLVGGSDSSRGRLEVYHDGRWGTVCDDDWDIEDGQVACLQMGFGAVVDVISKGGSKGLIGRDPIWLDNVECTGLEDNIADCEHNGWGVTDCTHFEDAGLVCIDNVPDIPVRLVGGSVSTEGRVEVFYRGEWGTICDDNWDINEAQVVCRQLGYDIAFAAYGEAKFGEGSGTIWMDELQCNGNEQNILEDCRFNGWGRNDCDHTEDAGVLCLVAVTVTERPQDKFADVGSIITFECLTNGSEPIIYHWFKDSVRIEEDGDRILGLDKRILNITTVKSSDYGYYRCDVNNLVNADLSEHALLTVSPENTVTVSPERIVINRTDSATLHCNAGGGPDNTYQWYHDNRLLQGRTQPTLSLNIVGISDGGDYNCTVTNAAGSGSSTSVVLISVRYTEEPVSQTAMVGESVTFNCTAIGSEPIVYTWFKDGVPLSDTDHIVGTATARLTIQSVIASDYGSYSCDVTNPVNNLISELVIFTVSPATLVTVSPSPEVLVNQKETATLECTAGGGPGNMFQWYHGDQFLVGETSAVLEIRNAMVSDEGSYNCSVNNTAGSGSNVTTLIVGVLFTGEPQDQGATVRDTVQFTCGVTGSNPISFEWFKNGNLLADNAHFSGTTTASLRIMSVASDDYGRYSCRASNPVNSVRSRGALLTVSPEALVTVTPPIMVLANQSDSVTLSCSSEGGPGNTFQWSHDGTDLQGETDPVLQLSNLTATDGGRYTCTVTNPASKGRNSTNVIVSIILVKSPVDKRATVGDVVSFNCTVAGSQPITYKWYHNGEVLMDDGRIIDSNTSSLTLTSLQLEDYGNYSCTADNPVNMVASDTAELTGQCDVINVTPEIIYEVGGTTLNITVSEPCLLSESDVITCTFDGISVTATYLNPKIAQCVVPPVGTVGNVTLTISGDTATNGFFYHQMNISSARCFDSMFPRVTAGSMLGGTPVVLTVEEDCLRFVSLMECSFANQIVPAVREVENPRHAFCTIPLMHTSGRIAFRFRAVMRNGGSFVVDDHFHLLPHYRAHEVVIHSDSLYLQDELTVEWQQGHFVSNVVSNFTSNAEIQLFTLLLNSAKWIKVDFVQLIQQTPGKIQISLPTEAYMAIRNLLPSGTVAPVAFRVEWTVSKRLTRPLKYWTWSEMYFLPSKRLQTTDFKEEIGKRCRNPYPRLNSTAESLSSCPVTEKQIRNILGDFEEVILGSEYTTPNYSTQYYQYLRPLAKTCFIQSIAQSDIQQWCCYGYNGYLLPDLEVHTVGSPMYTDTPSLALHIRESSLLDIYCCKEGIPKLFTCEDYRSAIANHNTTNYTHSIPGYAYGDPHLVTLDGYQYTFNGRGEFVILETIDGDFQLHGRMVQAKDENGTVVPATVFSAIAARQSGSDIVQIEMNETSSLMDVYINGKPVDFSVLTTQRFENVAISRESNVYIVKFSVGVSIEVQGELGMLSKIKTFVQSKYSGATQGLLGNYNGDDTDDLVPRNSTETLLSTSTLEDIHNLFGITWIINNSSESLFTYHNEQFEAFYDPTFVPMFIVNFSNPQLEEEAERLCGRNFTCMFDVAATGRLDIGLSTLMTDRELADTRELSLPVECNPPCQNGMCVADHVCSCLAGYSGPTCEEKVYTSCDEKNPCENAGICKKHGHRYECVCTSVFGGPFCGDYVGAKTQRGVQNIPEIAGAIGGGIAVVIVVSILLLFAIGCYRKHHKKKLNNPIIQDGRSENSSSLNTQHSFVVRHDSAADLHSENEGINEAGQRTDLRPVRVQPSHSVTHGRSVRSEPWPSDWPVQSVPSDPWPEYPSAKSDPVPHDRRDQTSSSGQHDKSVQSDPSGPTDPPDQSSSSDTQDSHVQSGPSGQHEPSNQFSPDDPPAAEQSNLPDQGDSEDSDDNIDTEEFTFKFNK